MMNPLTPETLINLITTAVILLGLLFVRWLIGKALLQRIPSLDTRHLWKQVTNYLLLLTALTILANIWFEGIGAALTVLSLVAAALTIIHKELILNLTTWSVILWRSLFGLGDRVQIGTLVGDVIDLGLLYFTLAEIDVNHSGQHTGRTIKVPNSLVLTQAVFNFTKPFRASWFEFSISLTPDSDWQAGEDTLLAVAADVIPPPPALLQTPQAEPLLGHEYLPTNWEPTVGTHVVDSKLTLSLRYACSPDQQALLEHKLWRAVLERLVETPNVKLALAPATPPPAA